MKITVIGESNIDIAVQKKDADGGKGCQPADIRFYHGGVARNIAHNLCLLGHDVCLMSVFGGDELASRLMDDCQAIGMDLSLSTVFAEEKSPIFLCINDLSGEQRTAFSDVKLNSRMDLPWLKARMDEINRSDMVVANTMLTSEALTYLIDNCEVPLYIDTVSAGRALRLVEAMKTTRKQGFKALKCNRTETEALTHTSDPVEAAKILNSKGISEVYITLGADGAIYGSANEVRHFPALPTDIVNVTGAGDAFLAGIVHANAIGQSGNSALTFALKSACHNIKSEAPVNPMLRLEVFND